MVRVRAGDPGPTFRWRAVADHFDLLRTLAARDVRVRYKQTALGLAWVVIQPLMAALIFSFVFGVVAGFRGDGRPYLLVAYSGMIAWNLFGGVVQRSSQALLGNAHLVTKVYFPREVLPLAASLATLLDFGVALGVMGVMLAWFGVAPGWGILLLPAWAALLASFGLGLGMLGGSLAVRYRDLQQVIPFALTLGLYASPVAWPASAIPDRYRWVATWNPLSGPIGAFRWSLLGEGTLDGPSLAYSAVAAGACLVLGLRAFRKMERRMADVL